MVRFVYNKNIQRLDKLSNDTFGNVALESIDVEEMLNEFWTLIDNDPDLFNKVYSNKRKRNALLPFLCNVHNDKVIITSSKFYEYLNLYADDESELRIHKWIYALISGWEKISTSKSNFDLLTRFISDKLDVISPHFNRTKNLKENTKLFLDKKGPHFFAKGIISDGISHELYSKRVGIIFKANDYHSMVTEELFQFYLKTKKIKKASEVIESISVNRQDYLKRTRRKVLSAFIIKVDKQGLNEYKELAKKTAFDVIGDPSDVFKWSAWKGANTSEKDQLENARIILNKWILTSFVELFFRIIINDPARQKYWLKKIPIITSIRIYGSGDDKKRLKRDERISSYVDKSRFTTLKFSNDDNAAIMMEMGNSQVVEFTGQGAMYCYDKSLDRIPKSPFRIENLKKKEIRDKPMASNSYGSLNLEGRIVHIGDWQGRTDSWIRKSVL